MVVIKDEAENESKIIRVLLVDDNEDQTELTKLSLEMADPQFRVQIIEKPEEALELLHVSHFDCILSDYKMPSMDGIKFCLTVRNFSKVPFIIYTGQSCEEIASDAFEAGADDYMRKGNEPSHFNVLAHRIRHVVEKSQALKELEESRRDLNRAQALSQTGSWRLDIRHNVLTWSDETHRMFGIPERQLMSYDSFLSFVHPMDRAYVDAKWAGAMKGEPYDIEHRIIVNGKVKWVRERAELEFDEDGSLLGGFGTVHDITQRRLAEAALRDREAEMAAILGGSPIPMFVVNSDRRVTLVNSAVENLTGRRFNEMKNLMAGNAIGCLNSLDDPRGCGFGSNCELCKIRSSILETLEKSKPLHQVEAELHLFDELGAKEMSVLVSTVPLEVSGQSRVLVCIEDVSTLKAKEDELSKLNEELVAINEEMSATNEELAVSEETLQRYSNRLEEMVEARSREVYEVRGRLESFMNSAVDGFSLWDHELNLVDANTEWLMRIPGDHSKKDLIGRSITELYPGIVETGNLEKYRKVVEKGVTYETEVTPNFPSLKGKVYSISAFRVGRGLGLISRDQTEKKKLDQELKRASIYARTLIEASLDPLFTIDDEGKITDINEAAIAAIGIDREHLISSYFADHFTQPMKATEGYLIAFERGSVRDYQLKILHSTGRVRDVNFNASVYRNEDGKVQGVFAAARDVTELKLAEEKLREAEKMEAIGKLTSMLAHDLRNPLIIVAQSIDMAKRHPEKTSEMFSMINRNIERALVMIDELRAGTREISLHRGETDLPTLIKRAAEMSVIPSNVNFTLNIGEGLMGVTLDGELMQRVLVNLMRNAVDAMPNGGSLAINAGSRDRKTVIEVTDTGCGIPDDILPEIFDTFYTTKPKGLGLGLAFSRRVIEAHGGEITVNTKLGEGTTFTITLPST